MRAMAKGNNSHYLKRQSSFIVVIIRSLRHGSCVCCGKPIHSFEESAEHWEKELQQAKRNPAQMVMEMPK